MTETEAARAARELADQLAADVQFARTREDHIRATARANTALALANGLDGVLLETAGDVVAN